MAEAPGVWVFAPAVFVWGLAVGSFANVAIYRVPLGMSVVRPRSACPSCATQIVWYDNIPVFSFVFLGGKCRHCGSRISARYPLVEAMVGLLWVGTFLRFGLSADLAVFFPFVTALVILSAIDAEHRRLPNKVLGPATVIAVVLLAIAAAATGRWESLGNAGLGAAAYGLPMFTLAFAYPKGMGLGDVKLAGYLGLHLGWLGLTHVLLGAVIGFFAGGFTGIVLLATGRRGRKDMIPFGPFMAAGALVAVFFGGQILRLWLGTFVNY